VLNFALIASAILEKDMRLAKYSRSAFECSAGQFVDCIPVPPDPRGNSAFCREPGLRRLAHAESG